ncbi:rhomboid family intramembrane serine protease [Haloferula chungangensis]|uniref:Rhomboid family intramembrane serine protease n=1 Tax=Haloferula chungangensis TaxID=1048331 RepID=A0ABW2L7L2_9BACT
MRGGSVSKWSTMGSDLIAARATLGLVGLLFLIQLAIESSGGFAGNPELFGKLGLSRQGISNGDFWQPFSYALIHGNWVHLMMNAFGLLAIGPRIERIGGARLLLVLLIAGWLMGGLFHLMMSGGEVLVPLVGISGGVAAALLWLTGVSPGSRMWPLPISGKNLGIGVMLASGLLAVIQPALGQGRGADVSHACHFGGGLLGWAMARWALRPRVTLAKLQKERARREAAGGPARSLNRRSRP